MNRRATARGVDVLVVTHKNVSDGCRKTLAEQADAITTSHERRDAGHFPTSRIERDKGQPKDNFPVFGKGLC
jgi:hypothetical protein